MAKKGTKAYQPIRVDKKSKQVIVPKGEILGFSTNQAIDIIKSDPKPISVKGDYNQECYRTSCSNKEAEYYNHSTRKHYCKKCADILNNDVFNKADAQRLFGHELCTLRGPYESLSDEQLMSMTKEELQLTLITIPLVLDHPTLGCHNLFVEPEKDRALVEQDLERVKKHLLTLT